MLTDRLPIAEILWEDTATEGPWGMDPLKATTAFVRSVGYFHVTTDKKHIRISQSHGADGTWADTTVIPRVNVKRLRILAHSRYEFTPVKPKRRKRAR